MNSTVTQLDKEKDDETGKEMEFACPEHGEKILGRIWLS
jgi:hypothetical protein